MLKELAQYIADLAMNAEKTEVLTIDGDTYINGKLQKPLKCSSVNLNALQAAVDFIETTCATSEFDYPLIVSLGHRSISVFSSLNKYRERELLLEAKALTPNIYFDEYMDLERFIIQFQTCFMDTPNKNNLLELISSFVQSEKVEVADNGISQTVSVEKGAVVKSKENLQVQPFVRLQAYRTFREVEQPETIYLLRVKEGNRIALFEADGGQWKLHAQQEIGAYLRQKLSKLIEEGKVVVIG